MHSHTQAIHIGQTPEATFGAVVPPIYMTSTYAQDHPGIDKGYDYTRAGNPNFTNLESTLAALEHGQHATVFSSGLGAGTALFSTLKPGARVLASDDLYGGTYRMFTRSFGQFGIQLLQVDWHDRKAVEQHLQRGIDLIIIETPTNPLLRLSDIQSITQLARQHGVTTVVDNTFASPINQHPLTLGADVVWHSLTKYIGGHSDIIGGALITNDQILNDQFFFARLSLGLNPSPFDVWLTQRSLKTLPLRIAQHNANALHIAQTLQSHPLVRAVHYPGLPSHPHHQLAQRQMTGGFGGMVSIEFDLTLDQMKSLISSFTYFRLAESLGGVESLVNHPASMTHASIPADIRAQQGLTDGLVRFSVGIEHPDDLTADILTALAAYE